MSRRAFKKYSLAVPVLLAFLAQGQQALAEENKSSELVTSETTASTNSPETVVSIQQNEVTPVTPGADSASLVAEKESIPAQSSGAQTNSGLTEVSKPNEVVAATPAQSSTSETEKATVTDTNSTGTSGFYRRVVAPANQTSPVASTATSPSVAPTQSTQQAPVASTSSTNQQGTTTADNTALVKPSEKTDEAAVTNDKFEVTNVDEKAGSFDIEISNITNPENVAKVLVPVWSEINNQDDLKWYEAQKKNSGNYAVKVQISNHKGEGGLYHAHLYYVDHTGKQTPAGRTQVELKVEDKVKTNEPSGKIAILNQNNDLGTFDVVVTDIVAPKGLSRVSVPVWSEQSGQDDIKWYTANKQLDGSYKVSVNARNHKDNRGLYHTHVYLIQSDGSSQAIGRAQTTLTTIEPTGNLSIQNQNDKLGSFDVVVTNVYSPKGVRSVLVPVWSETSGQDDIKWYTASKQNDGSYRVNVQADNHKNSSGLYHAHLYYIQNDGTRQALGGVKTDLKLTANQEAKTPSGEVTIKNLNDKLGTFDVVISKVVSPKGLRSVSVPVWSATSGQDDIKWYTADKQNDGSYKVSVSASNHKNSTGTYYAHVYLVQGDGSSQAIGATQTRLNYVAPAKTDTAVSITIANKNDKNGTFDVVVTNVAKTGVKRVAVPVWSELNGQDDIRWYDARPQANGSYLVNVNAANHKNSAGTYHAHLYYEMTDGSLKGMGGTSSTLNFQKTRSKVIFIDPGHGGKDPGAYYGGTAEKTLTLDVSNMLKRRLEASGYQVVMSRTGDQHVDFVTERSRLANNSNADIFVSIHFNASGAGTTKANGIETYWYQSNSNYPSRINQAMHNNPVRLAESETLARSVQTNLVSTTGATNRGVKRNTFAVLRETSKPAILVELGYMDNPTELAKMKQRSYQEKLAEGLAKGILSWYGTVGATATAVPAPTNTGFRSASVTATTGGTHQLKNLSTQQTQFLDAVYPSVKSASRTSGLLPSVMTAQAILESGWGQSRLASSPNNNLFGIKADSSWTGSTTSVSTKEFVDGRYIDTAASFRTYRNWAESISNYATFFTSTPWRAQRYAGYLAAKTYQTALPALQVSGYATDPNYASKLRNIIERYNLQAWDN